MPEANLRHRRTGLLLTQNTNDLLLGDPLFLIVRLHDLLPENWTFFG